MTQRGAQMNIDPGGGPSPAASEDRLRAEQLVHLCNNWSRAPLPIAVVCAAIVYIVWRYADPVIAIGWAVITVGALVVRQALARRLIATGALHARTRFWARVFPAMNFVHGAIGGSPGVLFFPALPQRARRCSPHCLPDGARRPSPRPGPMCRPTTRSPPGSSRRS